MMLKPTYHVAPASHRCYSSRTRNKVFHLAKKKEKKNLKKPNKISQVKKLR